jgi:hypothetical protein
MSDDQYPYVLFFNNVCLISSLLEQLFSLGLQI